jgi:hypothetical protein
MFNVSYIAILQGADSSHCSFVSKHLSFTFILRAIFFRVWNSFFPLLFFFGGTLGLRVGSE